MRIPFLLKKLLKNEKIVLTSKQVYSIVSLVFERTQYARVAQLVERDLAKVEAAGSSPVSRSFHAKGYPIGYPFLHEMSPDGLRTGFTESCSRSRRT